MAELDVQPKKKSPMIWIILILLLLALLFLFLRGCNTTDQKRGIQTGDTTGIVAANTDSTGTAKDKITIHSKGQSDPVASNETTGGRQLNRSVQIVAIK